MTSDTPEGIEPTNVPQTWPASPDEVATGGEAAQTPEAGAYTPAAPVPYVASPPTSNNAIIAFVLSIVSWALCPVIPAIVALVLAQSAQREIAASQGAVQGGGLVTASKIISWINIGFWAAFLVIGAFVTLLIVVAGSA